MVYTRLVHIITVNWNWHQMKLKTLILEDNLEPLVAHLVAIFSCMDCLLANLSWFVRHLVQNLPRSDEKAIRSKHLTFSCYIFPLDIFYILWARQCMKADWAWTFDDQNDWWYIHAYLSTPKWSYCRVCWEISMHIYIWDDPSILTYPLGRGLPGMAS